MKQIQKRIVLIIECFPGNSSYQGSCSHSGPKSIPASPGILSVTLGSSLDLLWALWGQFRPWSGPISACICSLSPLLWRLDWFQLWEYSHLFRYSSYTGFTELISGILWNCTERFPLLFLSHTAYVAKHGFDSISACLLPSDTCSLSRWEGGKTAAAWGTITHSDRIVTPVVACSGGSPSQCPWR